jgi:predicted aconitase
MILTDEEQALLDGRQGETLRKVMRSVVAYGEVFGAERLVPIEGMPHLVTSFGANTIRPYFDMVEEILEDGLKFSKPFTVDPRPMEYEALNPSLLQRLAFKFIFGKQAYYEAQLRKLGIKDENAFSCACYLPEVGNIPRRGAYLAWSESSAVVYANSVLGARTNRNSGGIDLMCDIVGKAPYFGLLTEEGRIAAWKVELKLKHKPNPQLLGSAIGLKVMEDVPYICGLDEWLGQGLNPATQAFLKDMGAASASNGAVGLYHVERITPEAVEEGVKLLKPGYGSYIIDDSELQRVRDSYPLLWKDAGSTPKYIFVGCPHLTGAQLSEWVQRIELELRQAGRDKTSIPTYLFTAPDIAIIFRKDGGLMEKLVSEGIHITTICPLMYMNNPLCARQPIATNSNKLRTYSTARFYPDEEIIQIMASGKVDREVGYV